MLALTRRRGEQIIIGTGETAVLLEVVKVDRGKAILAFDAPPSVSIDRVEVRLSKDGMRAKRGPSRPAGHRAPDQSSNMLEIAAEITDPVKWAAMMICKGGSECKTVGEAFDMIERIVRKAIASAVKQQANKGEGRG